MKKTLIARSVGLSCIVMMAFAAPTAMAQGSSEGGYDEAAPLSVAAKVSGETADGTTTGDDKTVKEVRSGTLPFTGLDLGVAVLLGLTLVGTGVVVRRAARQSG